MDEAASYRAPAGPAEVEIRERGSRFRAQIVPAREPGEAATALDRIRQKDPSATHHCWAWRIGWPPAARASDAGEPSGTAGPPILRAIEGAGVSDCLLVVSRWFGGVKLGRGGLARAYGAAARGCLASARLVERFEVSRFVVELPYDRLGGVERLLGSDGVEILRQSFAETVVFELTIASSRADAFSAELANLGRSVRVTRVGEAATRGDGARQ